ncbi:Formyltetrahydrofolate deformylase [hydrothermal vent metagenome]|uniref:Formyltetrahydrofolate deformylase n=1 Tax=hydrothermal vent metagenome TaxID=652676 RepID=A0A3B1E8W8_9ZZZZ
MINEYRLLIDTEDKKGLVYKVSEILYKYGLNIEKNSEYVDKNVNKFFMRTIITGDFDTTILLEHIKQILPTNAEIQLFPAIKKDIIILATKETHCLGDILIKNYSGELDANIKAVISNHNDLEQLVNKFDIPYEFIDSNNISRQEHETKIIDKINAYGCEIIVLAKYMRILTPNFVKTFSLKILNIHHSFLPAFIGANPYKQAYDRGVKLIGATAHYVTNDLDEGPIIAQDIVRIDHSLSLNTTIKAGRNIETTVLSNALDLLLRDKVFVYKNKTVIL